MRDSHYPSTVVFLSEKYLSLLPPAQAKATRGKEDRSSGVQQKQFRISDCELRIEFEEAFSDGALSTNPLFEIRNPQFPGLSNFGLRIANRRLNLKKPFQTAH
jgi:hypothetical protein